MLSEKELKKAAEELNEVLGLNPPVVTEDVLDDKGKVVEAYSLESMIKQMYTGIALIDPKLDEFSKRTDAIIVQLKAEQEPVKEEPKKGRGKKAPAKEVVKEEKESEEEEEEKEEKPVKEKSPVSLQKTRASVMRDILLSGPFTAKEMTEEMHRRYGGTRIEAGFQVGIFLRILYELNLIEAEDGNKLRYIGKYNV